MILLDPQSPALAGIVRAGDCVMWGQAGAEPLALTRALMAQRHAVGHFSAFIGATWSDTARPEYADRVAFHSYCGAGANRALSRAGVLDILPCHYSEMAAMLRSGRLKIDVLLLQLAPADASGRYSLSVAHEYLVPALAAARVVIAEINAQAPYTHGERYLLEADIDYALHTDRRPLAPPSAGAGGDDASLAVARNVASLIGDGATLQCGIGALPDAVLAQLADRCDLGIHTGALGDQAALLCQAGVVTNGRKNIDRGVTVAGLMMGGQRVYDYAHNNPHVQFRSTEYTHSADVLAQLDRFTAINSALEVDITGQVNAETVGGGYAGAVGGLPDFIRGAHRSHGGLPIIALPSQAGAGQSRIVSALRGPATLARGDAGIVVTEYGIADLRGLSIARRIERMIGIAHPDARAGLERECGRLRIIE